MAQEIINVGTANARDGDDLRASFVKVNNNFSELFGEVPSNRVLVQSASDLSGTLSSTVEYFIDGVIDMSGVSIEVPAGGLYLRGYNFDLSKLVSNDASYTMFTSPIGGSGNVLMTDMALTASGTGSQVYDIVSDTGFEAIELLRVNYEDCTSLGTIDNYRQGLEEGTGRFGGSPTLELVGTWLGGFRITTSIVRNLSASMTSPLFKAGALFQMNSRFLTDINCDLPASASFCDFSAVEFPNPSTVQLQGMLLSRNGSYNADDANLTPNIAASSLSCAWRNNVGIPNTFEGGTLVIGAEIATVVALANTFYDLDGVFGALDLQHFDFPANGQLRHLGESPREYRLLGDLVIVGTANDEIAVKVVKWDDSASSFVDIATQVRQINNFIGGRNAAFFNATTTFNLDNNDYIKLQVENRTAARNVTAELDSFFTVLAR